MVSTIVSIPGYQISEELYNGSRTLVYRGYRETDSLPVVIKLLKNPYPSLGELLSFHNQYTIAKNLNSPLIIQTYSLEAYQNGYALVMEDFGGISLKNYFTSVETRYIASLQQFLEIVIALCNTLDILYRARIIHKDIKPSNILINPETKQIKLIDFSIASLLPRETQTLMNPNVLEGTLAYISPEQTGRMNRGIDYRTDFYSLGVTFYELLTGELPFQSNEPMELVHCHIAKTTPLVHEINPQIPSVLSEIVNKLMAKNAEDRYQSALGLKFDLEKCLTQIQNSGEIQSFEIARRDVCDRFTIPEKLYGRETEVQTLLDAFDRVSQGNTEIMLVAGFSGIGKTAVVNEVHKPIARQRGYFIKGKYDQFQRNIPFSAFVQAFRDLMGQLLSESDAQLQTWKTKILEAVGDSGQVLIDVIPELERIIGTQPPATELSGSAAQNRFNLLMQKFVKIFTSQSHPLVMFLDDLQWSDSASLNLLQLLMQDSQYLLILGAYRDNEVSLAHPFILKVDEIVKTGAVVNMITLQPLSLVDLNQLVADTLNCELFLAQPLTELVSQKTKGNPFFATQFLKALYEDGQITFDPPQSHARCFKSAEPPNALAPLTKGGREGGWQCDIAEVRALAITDDVVEFMAVQLKKLPRSTQEVLKLAACIGAQFDLNTLAIVSEKSLEAAATDLWKALQEGLIIPNTEAYKFFIQSDSASVSDAAANPIYRFLHDRVQQAAYYLIPDDQKTVTHLQIGQLLQRNLSDLELEEKLFDLVGHLNLGIELISQASDRQALAQLNLQAGVKARNSTAYAAARVYLQTGIQLLQTNCWQSQYDLTLNLYVAMAEASYLNGDFTDMKQQAELVLQQAQTIFDKVKIYEIQIAALTAQIRVLEAIAVGRDVLSQLGVDLPTEVDSANIGKALQELNQQLQGREIAELIELPTMSDRTAQAAMQLLGMLFSPVFQGMPGLMPLLSATMVRLSLQFGNAPVSIVGYVIHGTTCAFGGEVKTGYSFGRLALSLLERLHTQGMKPITLSLFGAFIQHRQEALRATLPMLKEGYTSGMETGDFVNAGYCIVGYSSNGLCAGVDLDTLATELTAYNAALAQVKQASANIHIDIVRQTLQQLSATVSQPDHLIGGFYDETVRLPQHEQDRDLAAIATVYSYKLLLAYCFGNYQAALSYITPVKSYFMAVSGATYVSIFHFYAALTHLALFHTQSEAEQADGLLQVQIHQTVLHQWADHAPMNHLHKWYLVEAEKHRVLGEKVAATECYDQAINLAKEHQFINEEALAKELAAKFYLNWGKQRLAQEYMIEAYYGYARWGAKAKVADLEQHYPQLLAPILEQTRSPLSTHETLFTLGSVTSTSAATSSSSISVALDLATILKASQIISGEIELEKLVSSLLSLVIENAGANKCVLILVRDERLLIKGSITEGTESVVLQRLPIEDSQDIPLRLIYKVKHERQTVVLLDVTTDPTLASDPYIICQQPKSILCSPILHQGKLRGILYLENNLATGAFTSDRVELLNLLCAQAAISLENARLYEQSQTYAQQLEQALREQQKLAGVVQTSTDFIGIATLTGQAIYLNPAGRQLVGLDSAAEISNFQMRDFHSPEDFDRIEQEILPRVMQQGVGHGEMNFRHFQTGQLIPTDYVLFAIEDPLTNQPLCLASISRDIRDVYDELRLRKKAEAAIIQKSQELEQALHDLQQTQLQMIQSEKMSALGNLVAGVAHEMNNPLGFIAASLKLTKPTFTDIVEHLGLYQSSLPNKSEEIIDHAESIDLDYSLSDLPKMIDSMSMACDRLKNISTSLRTFSRADQDYKVPFNIHQGIDSTILILKHRLKANPERPAIEVVTNYGNLPEVECFPGQLNQVFMNIIANAIDALDESNTGRIFEEVKANPNCITITTSVGNNLVKIAIADNGKGMNESVKQKIFDHLFTTKAVGKGTGLGLAIARQIIVEKHGGAIEVNSQFGKGTEFVIQLPLFA